MLFNDHGILLAVKQPNVHHVTVSCWDSHKYKEKLSHCFISVVMTLVVKEGSHQARST